MLWEQPIPAASTPVDAILDKENFTLEELLQEEELKLELEALNSRLINFLSGKEQVMQLLQYIVGEPPEGSDTKFSYISCEILTSNIDAILNTLLEDDQLMDFLFSFLEPNRDHKAQLAEYFRKVVLHLIHRKTLHFMIYIEGGHKDVFRKLVNLIGVSAITKLLIQLLGDDDNEYVCPDHLDVVQWLANSNLLEMIVDKLDPHNAPTVHSNASEILCAVAGNVGSPLARKLSSPRFIEMLFGHALQDSASKSSLTHSLSVCITLLDPKRADTYSPLSRSFQSEDTNDDSILANPEIINAMLPKFGDLLSELNSSSNVNILPTTFGELKPPLGRHRVKIVELIAVLVHTDSDAVERELVGSGIMRRIVDLFFEYPFNNFLHHHVESIVSSCLIGKRHALIDNLLHDCNLVGKILHAERNINISDIVDQPTISSAGRMPPRDGNIGHITTMANWLVWSSRNNILVQTLLQENGDWSNWQANILKQRNDVENSHGWACGRPAGHRMNDNVIKRGGEAIHDEDSRLIAPAAPVVPDQEENKDGSIDDEPSEAFTTSLRLGDNQQQKSLFTNANWFSDEKHQNWDETPFLPTELIAALNLKGAEDEGDDSRKHTHSRASTSKLNPSRFFTSSSSNEKGETSSGFAEAPNSASGHNELDFLQGLIRRFSLCSSSSNDASSEEVQGTWTMENPFDIGDVDWKLSEESVQQDGSLTLTITDGNVTIESGPEEEMIVIEEPPSPKNSKDMKSQQED
ncbi:hypothetical protein MLD38_025253 [Melastoma candidum]|uniref:Uncharacterized protein n=1 Tax=Melastoma candidum TaxID=119954 RepID=A0ACB9NXW4_9MYRT|nr:hypothetical protein MLD38_025253 [Melastoma candidum]